MPASIDTFAEVGVAQTLDWLRRERGVQAELRELSSSEGIGLARLTLAGERDATVAVVPLFTPDAETDARGAALAHGRCRMTPARGPGRAWCCGRRPARPIPDAG